MFIVLLISACVRAQTIYKGGGKVSFISEAPLETIEAESNILAGIIDKSKMNFAFKLNVSSFDGFNSALQKEHFKEHYLETRKYPDATFLGKIILDNPCKSQCKTKAICKGKFKIHGITQIVSIPVDYEIKNNIIYISGDFKVLLSDYKIKIPRIVQAKISPEILVYVDIEMMKQP